MLVLGIETTCDETACAIVRDGKEVLSSIISSQIDLHAEFGGVVPELSCRRHVDILIPVIQEALKEAKITLKEIDLIAVAYGPGLVGALLIGITSAKTLAISLDKPFIGVNHIEAHLYAAIMSQQAPPTFPCLGVVLSGGHTSLVRMDSIGSYTLIGETVDDAVGEAFDKVAKLLGLPYPGGPQIEALALKGHQDRFAFKAGKVKGHPFDFSFSGLKTAVLYALKGQNKTMERELTEQDKADVAFAFQHAAFTDIVDKATAAAVESDCRTIVFGGGVTNNQELRRRFSSHLPNHRLLWPSVGLSLDNAAMIAGLGYHTYLNKGAGDSLNLEAATRIAF